MARGNEIIVSAEPRGVFKEGYIAAGVTPKPGTIMSVDLTVAIKGGRFTWRPFTPGTTRDGQAGGATGNQRLMAVLLPDQLQGKTAVDAYAAGDRCFLYVPHAGEELNCLVKDIAGTADDHLAGEVMIVDAGTGKLVVTTGTPESEPFILLEAITDPVADTLAWVLFTGY